MATTTSYVEFKCEFCDVIFTFTGGYHTEHGNICRDCWRERGINQGSLEFLFNLIREKKLNNYLMANKKKTKQPMCGCGRAELFPGEEFCHLCLNVERKDEIDDDYIGSEEWKEEMRYWWPKVFPKVNSTSDSPSVLIGATSVA